MTDRDEGQWIDPPLTRVGLLILGIVIGAAVAGAPRRELEPPDGEREVER